jgi:hypothetical protein
LLIFHLAVDADCLAYRLSSRQNRTQRCSLYLLALGLLLALCCLKGLPAARTRFASHVSLCAIRPAMKAAIALLLLTQPAVACDWAVSEKVDPMTDQKTCTITSPTVRLSIGVRGDVVTFVSSSRYRRDYLTIRVDDQPAMQLSERGRSTDAFEDDAREALAAIRSGQRIRVQYRDLDGTANGDGAICNLLDLISACR